MRRTTTTREGRRRGICSAREGQSARIVMVGLDSAGKSTILARFKNLVDQQSHPNVAFIERIDTIPTFVYQVETIYPRLAPLALNVWDLGGQEKTRELWRFYITGVEGVIFVIDSTDQDRFIVAREELMAISSQIDPSSSMSIVIAANKQDLSESWKRDELMCTLALPKILSGEWKLFEISAQTGAGVMELFCYLSQSIHNRR